MNEDGRALYHRVVDHELVIESHLLAVDGFWVEFDLTDLGEKFWRSARKCKPT